MAPPYDLVSQHAQTLRLLSPYGQIGDWINELTPPAADRSAEATIAGAIAGRLAIMRQEIEPLIATEAAKAAEAEIADLAERLADAREAGGVAFDRECRNANPLALEAALERIGAVKKEAA